MSVTHRVNDEILADYAAGNLPEAFSLVVAAHASLCPEARARLGELEAVGGAVLERQEPAAMAHGALEATLARIAAEDPAPEPEPSSVDKVGCDVLPAPIRAYVGGGIDAVQWRPLGMGAKQAILKTSREATARLLYIPAGSQLPDHGHAGLEMTLVLQGAFLDGDARFARGDVETVDEDIEHTPVADLGEDCICIAATDAPLKFSRLLPRIAQPFLRI
jgi:putative transcriptional regulator